MRQGLNIIYYPQNSTEEAAVPIGALVLKAGETEPKRKTASGIESIATTSTVSSALASIVINDWVASVAVALNEVRRATASAGTIELGDLIRSNSARTTGSTFNATEAGNWTEFTPDIVTSVAGRTGAVSLANTDITGFGTASTLNVAVSGNAATGEIVKGSDSRLSDSRTPTTHSHQQSDVSSLTTDLAAKEATANKGVANGYASLGADGILILAQRPIFSTTTTTSIAPILGAKVGFPGYRRSKLIPINSTTTGSGDYQVELLIGESSGSTGIDFHLGANSQDFPATQKDGGELKFVLPDGTDIPFFVAEVTGTTPNRVARIFLRIAGVTGQASSVQKLVFLLYDNNLYSVVSQMSAITGVFNLLADDFDGTSVDGVKWVSTGVTVANGIATMASAGSKLASVLGTYADNMELIVRKQIGSTTSSYTGCVGWTNTQTAGVPYFGYGPANNQIGYYWDWGASAPNGYKWTKDTTYTAVTAPTTTAYGLYRVSRAGGNANGIYPAGTNSATGVFTGVGYAVIDWAAGNDGFVDWAAVRQFLATPPSIGTVQDV